jgi:diguanylate cyclase (GGDEF)-like protein/PAS domain S-box-containing protein
MADPPDASVRLTFLEERLRQSEEQFRLTFEFAPIGMALLALDGQFQRVNPAMCRLLGRREPELRTASFASVCHPDDLIRFLDQLGRTLEGDLPGFSMEQRYVRPDGQLVWAEASAALVFSHGAPQHCILQTVDVTERHRREEVLRRDALSDPLTGLMNRSALLDHLEEAERWSAATGSSLTVLYVDLDRFKPVNDRHGHVVGDAVLRVVAERLRHSLRADDVVARLGGDEFVIVSRAANDAADGTALARRLRQVITAPVHVEGLTLSVGASIGIHTAAPGERPGEVLERADAAMYRAKNGPPPHIQVSAGLSPTTLDSGPSGDGRHADLDAPDPHLRGRAGS